MKKLLLGSVLFIATLSAQASTVGLSSHPFEMRKHIVATEFNSYFSNGAGMGITAKYLQRMNENLSFDAGFGITDGERASKMTFGADYSLMPDYGNQPRVSLKGLFESENFDGDRVNSMGIAPTISKGYSFWGNEAFPYLALPVKINLNSDEGTYETSTAISAGISGQLPISGIKGLVGNLETNFALRNSYTALVMGVSLPLQ